MSSTIWNIFVSMYYISYLIILIPFLVLYYLFANCYRRVRNKRKVKRILKQGGLPEELSKGVSNSYKNMMKLFKISNLVKAQNFIKSSNKDKENSKFPRVFPFSVNE